MKCPQKWTGVLTADGKEMQRGAASRALILLLLVLCAVYIYQKRQQPAASISASQMAAQKPAAPTLPVGKNSLRVGVTAQSGTVDITLYPPIDLNYRSRSDVLELRSMLVKKNAQLLVGQYTPSAEVFGQIVDGLPWWGMEGIHHGPGPRSIEGPAEESRFLMNPYLLVAALFHGRTNWHAPINGATLATAALDCPPSHLEWRPHVSHAEVSYDADCVAARGSKVDLVAYNARDFGLPYIYVSYAESTNIFRQNAPSSAYANPQYIRQGGSCGYPGGCNNMSPATPPIENIELARLPASIVVLLWRDKPDTVSQVPDMRFILHIR